MAYRKLRQNVNIACHQNINSLLPRHRHNRPVSLMERKNVRRRIVLLLLLPVFAICISAIPLTNPVSFFHNISTSRFASQNATSPGFSFDPLDYPIIGTPLILRITETGKLFTEAAVHRIIDRSISEVVAVINRGSGRDSLVHNRFGALTEDIELRIQSIPDRGFTYFFLGKQTHCRRCISINLINTCLTCALRESFVIIPAAPLRFRGLWTKY